MATTHGPSENNYLAATPGNDKIYGYESNGTQEPASRPPKKVLILESLVCISTAAGGSSPDQISLKVANQTVWENSMNAGDKANLVWSQDFHQKVYIQLLAGESGKISDGYIRDSGNESFPLTNGQASYTLTYEISDSSAI
jgi:hypothetical protein